MLDTNVVHYGHLCTYNKKGEGTCKVSLCFVKKRNLLNIEILLQ